MKNIPYARQWIEADDIAAVVKTLKSDYLTQGPAVENFEKAVTKYCGAKYAVAVNSGTSALHIAALAAGIKSGDEVVTSPISFVASANCVLYCGAKPVFADIEEDTVNIDVKDIERKITPQTKAIIPVDFAGQPVDLEKISHVARKHNLIVIEDASHAVGASYKGKKTGSCQYSDMTVLSFHAVKQITAAEGGMVVTNSETFYEKLLRLRTHGVTRSPKLLSKDEGGWYYEMLDLGFNYRMTDVQCALGISQLKKLNRFVERRREIVAEYNCAFSKFDEIRTLAEKSGAKSSHHLYVLRFLRHKLRASRRAVFDEYRKHGLLVNVHYIPIYYQPYYRDLGYAQGLCPKAEHYYEEAITLPLFPKMSKSDVRRVIQATEKIILKFKK